MEKKVLQLYTEGNNYTTIAQMLGKSDKSIDNAPKHFIFIIILPNPNENQNN